MISLDVLRRRLTRTPSPSVDLYFLTACAPLVGPDGPIRRRGPTVFETDEAVLVIRHDVGAEIAPDERRRLIYLLDDAAFAGVADPTLPSDYRLKLRIVECATARRLLPRADCFLVSTPEVAETTPRTLLRPDLEIIEIAPAWGGAPADLGHFDGYERPRIAFTGAQTHRAGLRFVAPAAAAALDRRPDAEFSLAANHRPPRALRRRPGLRPEPARPWPEYRAALAATRRHVALYPLPATPFARARSINKLIEHGLMGAAPLYSETWPRAARAAAAGAGLMLSNRRDDWIDALLTLLSNEDRARRLAQGAATLARRLDANAVEAQAALWRSLFAC